MEVKGKKVKEIYIDGSINGWDCTTCFIIVDKYREALKKEINVRRDNEKNTMTVCEAEYDALIEAIIYYVPGIIIYSDSVQLVQEIKGLKEISNSTINRYYKLKETIERLYNDEGGCISSISQINIEWMPREKNLAGIYLEKRLQNLTKAYNEVLKTTNIKQSNKQKKKKKWLKYGRRT